MKRHYYDRRSKLYSRYGFGTPFMERGGIYGRSRRYPWRAGRIKRVFRTAIHYRDHAFDVRERWQTLNTRAFNDPAMHVLFAYQWRPTPWRGVPDGGGEYRTGGEGGMTEKGGTLVFDFKITLPKAA